MKTQSYQASARAIAAKCILPIFAAAFIFIHATAADIRLYFVNQYTGQNYTNPIIVTPISTNILSNGGVVQTGVPLRVNVSTNGFATNYIGLGWYSVRSLASTSPVVINVSDSSQMLYDITNVLQSGFNTYVVTTYGTNPPPTYDEITNAIGFVPISQSSLEATNTALLAVIADQGAAGTNNTTQATNDLNTSLRAEIAEGDSNGTNNTTSATNNLNSAIELRISSSALGNTNFTLYSSNSLAAQIAAINTPTNFVNNTNLFISTIIFSDGTQQTTAGSGGSSLWTSSGGAVYPSGAIGGDTVWTNNGSTIYPL